jgi:hypothetical protein
MGLKSLFILVTTTALAPGAADASSASFIRQEFSQIPAPGAIALLGLAGLTSRRRRS